MNARIADRLNAARRRRIVGRASECALFREALETPELPFYVLSVFGPGGIGKTSLLSAYAQICAELQIPVCMLNGQDMEPSPDFFQRGFRAERQSCDFNGFSLHLWLPPIFIFPAALKSYRCESVEATRSMRGRSKWLQAHSQIRDVAESFGGEGGNGGEG